MAKKKNNKKKKTNNLITKKNNKKRVSNTTKNVKKTNSIKNSTAKISSKTNKKKITAKTSSKTNNKNSNINKKNVTKSKNIKGKSKKKQTYLQKNIKNIKKNLSKYIKDLKKNLAKYINNLKIKYSDRQLKKLENKEENSKIREEQKEFTKNNKKIIQLKKSSVIVRILIVVILLVSIIYILLSFNKKNDEKHINFETISINKYVDLYKKEDVEFIYIKKDNCAPCQFVEQNLDKIQKEYKIKFNTINISKLDEKDMNKLKNSNKLFNDKWDAPLIFSIDNGELITSLEGYKEYSVLKRFVDYSKNPSNNNSFTKIDIDKYLALLKSNNLSIIYIGESNSSACKLYDKILEEVSVEKNLLINYLNTDIINKESDWNKLSSSNKIFNDIWFVPVTLLVKDGKIIDYKMEAMDKDTLIDFLNRNGV